MPWILLTILPMAAALQWTDSLTNSTVMTVCSASDVQLPFNFTLSPGERIEDIKWIYREEDGSELLIAMLVAGYFNPMPAFSGHVRWTGQGGIVVSRAAVAESGSYTVEVITENSANHLLRASKTVHVQASELPTTDSGALNVQFKPGAVYDNTTGQWRFQLTCGHFTSLGQPAVDVIWTTPSGEVRNSSYEDSGTFVLSVSSPVQGGNYSCRLPPSTPAARCLTATSPLKAAAQLYVDDKDVRLSLLEARQGELLRENKDQTTLLHHQATLLQNQTNLIQSQARQISQLQKQSQDQNETVAKLEEVNKDQAIRIAQIQEQNLRQNESMAQLQTDLSTVTSQFASLSKTLDNLLERSKDCNTTAPNSTEVHSASRNYSSCVDWLKSGTSSGVHTVFVTGEPITVYCDQTTDNGGMIVFQRRVDGSVDFYRNWTEYRNGFGNMEGNFWLGLDKLHVLTASHRCELRVDLQRWDGLKGFATYSRFYVDDAAHYFALHFDKFTGGTAGDSLFYHNGMKFSTKDSDHDITGENCAQDYHGAWWYKGCYYSDLNGDYQDGISWNAFQDNARRSIKFSEMKIRPT